LFYFFKRKLQMKKSLVFVAMLAIALAACGKKEEAKPAEAPAAAPAAPAAADAPAAAPAAPAAAPAADAKK
jgi:predicted small lipoprotein YifL